MNDMGLDFLGSNFVYNVIFFKKRIRRMASKKIVYPRTIKDIPLWQRRQLKKDLLWFLRFSPVERLECIDREWEEIQDFIKKFGAKNYETGKRN